VVAGVGAERPDQSDHGGPLVTRVSPSRRQYVYERPSWAVPKDPQSRRTCLSLYCTPEPGHTEPAQGRRRRRRAPSRRRIDREDTGIMTSFSDLARDERAARMVLSMLTEPDEAVTGRLLARPGAVKTVRLLDGDGKVPGLGPVDAQV